MSGTHTVTMKLLAILLISGLTSAEWIKEMENENPHGMVELTPDQERFVGGDMVMTGYEEEDLKSGAAYTSVKNVWPKQGSYVTIPYENTISSSLAATRIAEAIAEYKQHTCIRFRRRTSTDKAYLSFYQGGGCSSPVGYHGSKNSISLAVPGCLRIGTVMHEIAHSLGIFHEQSRSDRDKHVTINWQNIPTKYRRNFDKYDNNKINSHGTPYDYESMMHYGGTAFGSGRITIKTKDPNMQNVIGQRSKMSDIDKKQINAMYKCGGSTGGGGTGGGGTGSCKDVKKTTDCKLWQGHGFCKSGSKYYDFMKKYCAKTCAHCGTTAKQVSCGNHKAVTCAQCPNGNGRLWCNGECFWKDNKCQKKVCRDLSASCPGWIGYCNNSQFKPYMTKNCPKTCKVC